MFTFSARNELLIFLLAVAAGCRSSTQAEPKLIEVDSGWAANSVNTVIFRKNALVSSGDTQYIAFYDPQQVLVLGKRIRPSDTWELKKTPYHGQVSDAHRSISIMVDGDGYLHVAWDHHGNPLHYARSLQPGSLSLSAPGVMTGLHEERVTYPEFYRMPGGNLLFLYRDGASGNGNLVVNRYDISSKSWEQVHANLLDGEGKRNAYWQACVDPAGAIHLSWVWRESPDVSSNHDLCYARSRDGGITWEKSNGDTYHLPITADSAEFACRIPTGSELINQTSMASDDAGNPYIASYWRDAGSAIPQYHLVYREDSQWKTQNLGFRTSPFSLSGQGSKRIPISRPQLILWEHAGAPAAGLLFRDTERGSRVSIAMNENLGKNTWTVRDLNESNVGSWEPCFDTEYWKKRNLLSLFVQKVEQLDAEGVSDFPPQMIFVLEWNPRK